MIKGKDIYHIWYTPLSSNIDEIIKRNCLVFIGSKDKWIYNEDIIRLKGLPNINLNIIEKAVHSLEIDTDYKASIRIIGVVTEKTEEYINRRMDTSDYCN